MRDRAAKGFTVVQGVIAWPDPMLALGWGNLDEKPLPLPNHTGVRTWDKTPAKLNEAFFDHVDHLVSFAEKLGLVLAILPTWGYFVFDAKIFSPETAHAYGRWIGHRYRDRNNIVWVTGGDKPPTGFEAEYVAMARGVQEGCEKRHLITYHPCGCFSSDQFFHKEDWLDFNMMETWASWMRIYPMTVAATARTPRKPIVLGEGAYEDGPEYPTGPITPLVIRRQAWWAFMAGGFCTYGQNQMWRMEIDFTRALNTPGALDMGRMGAILGRFPWWQLFPDQSLFASGVSSERTLNTAMLSEDASWALIYLSDQCHVRLHLERLKASKVKATWINPHTGQEDAAGTHQARHVPPTGFIQAETAWFSTPLFWEDALLLLEKCDD